jgi:hypothetical protein
MQKLIINDLETVYEPPKPADVTLDDSAIVSSTKHCLYFALKNLAKKNDKAEIWIAYHDESSEVYVWWSNPCDLQEDSSHMGSSTAPALRQVICSRFKELMEKQDDFKGWVTKPYFDDKRFICSFNNGYCTTKVDVIYGVMTLNNGESSNYVGNNPARWVDDLFVN